MKTVSDLLLETRGAAGAERVYGVSGDSLFQTQNLGRSKSAVLSCRFRGAHTSPGIDSRPVWDFRHRAKRP